MLLLLLRGLGLGRGVRFLFLRLSQRNTARSGFTHAKGGMKKKTDRVAERERRHPDDDDDDSFNSNDLAG